MMATPQQFPIPIPPEPNAYATPTYLRQKFSSGDIGADIQFRFSYQCANIALFAIESLLNKHSDFKEIYCESVEDIILRNHDGRYYAIQVKTRDNDLGPFTTTDPAIKKSLLNFHRYETEEARSFYKYMIATNVGFWHADKNYRNIRHILEIAIQANGKVTPELAEVLNNIFPIKDNNSSNNISNTIFGMVFIKLCLCGTLPSFGSERNELRNKVLKHISNRHIYEIDYVVDQLIAFIREHSDRSLEDRVGIDQSLSSNPEPSKQMMITESRLITRASLNELLVQASKEAPVIVKMREITTQGTREEQPSTGHPIQYEEVPQSIQSSDKADITSANRHATRRSKTIDGGYVDKQPAIRPSLPDIDMSAPDQNAHNTLGSREMPNTSKGEGSNG